MWNCYKLYQNDWYKGMLDFLENIKNMKYLTIPIFCSQLVGAYNSFMV